MVILSIADAERKQRHHHDGDADADHDRDYIQPPQPSLTPQVLFRYPAGSAAPISDEEVAALAFPTGVQALVLASHFQDMPIAVGYLFAHWAMTHRCHLQCHSMVRMSAAAIGQ